MIKNEERLEALATGRTHSFLQEDWDAHFQSLKSLLFNARVLIIGGAGSIGASFTTLLCGFSLKALHIQDISENGLVEVIRTIRGSPDTAAIPEIRTFAFDYGSPFLISFLQEGKYDFIFHFAAVKHVRSEKDPYSLAHLIETNIFKAQNLVKALSSCSPQNFFAISTDKAANPTSLMGASKRFMELLLFTLPTSLQVTSTRFANVAFSQGSLLEGWLYRLQKQQPVPVPQATKRYFISHQEAAQICLLTACIAPSHHVTIPAFQKQQAVLLEEIAEKYIRFSGFEPVWFEEEEDAKKTGAHLILQGKWPLLRTPLDTAGEKTCEEFVSKDERPASLRDLSFLQGIPQGCQEMAPFIKQLRDAYREHSSPPKHVIEKIFQEANTCYTPSEKKQNLDDRL